VNLSFQPVAVRAGVLSVARLGEGRPVVLIPNYGRAAQDFNDLAGRLASAGYEAVAINPRGRDIPPGSHPPTLHDLGSDIAASSIHACSISTYSASVSAEGSTPSSSLSACRQRA